MTLDLRTIRQTDNSRGATSVNSLAAEPQRYEIRPRAEDFGWTSVPEETLRRHLDREDFRARVFLWVTRNPGMDAEAVARHFGLSGLDAVEIVEELLHEGLLDFNE